jgi:hypothetical protein
MLSSMSNKIEDRERPRTKSQIKEHAEETKQLRKRMMTTIPPNALKTYLDTVLLMASLMLGFSASYLTSFDYEALNDADVRWVTWCRDETIAKFPLMDYRSSTGYCHGIDQAYYDVWPIPSESANETIMANWKYLPSADLGYRICWTYSSLAASIFVAFCAYVTFTFSDPESMPADEYKWWVRIFQWPIHVACLFFIIGVFLFCYANTLVYRLSYPDYPVLENKVKTSEQGSVWNVIFNYQMGLLAVFLLALAYHVVFFVLYRYVLMPIKYRMMNQAGGLAHKDGAKEGNAPETTGSA